MAISLFIAGNVWLIIALTLALGCKVARTEPTMYSFFDAGGWYYPGTYNAWIWLCLLAAIICFALSLAVWRRRSMI